MADQCFVLVLEVGNKRRKWKACAFVFVWPKGRWELRCRCLHKALLVLWALLPALFAVCWSPCWAYSGFQQWWWWSRASAGAPRGPSCRVPSLTWPCPEVGEKKAGYPWRRNGQDGRIQPLSALLVWFQSPAMNARTWVISLSSLFYLWGNWAKRRAMVLSPWTWGRVKSQRKGAASLLSNYTVSLVRAGLQGRMPELLDA